MRVIAFEIGRPYREQSLKVVAGGLAIFADFDTGDMADTEDNAGEEAETWYTRAAEQG